MTSTAILREIEQLPLSEKLFVMECTLKSIRTEGSRNLSRAVDHLYDDYKSDKELTAFTDLDQENFYEAG